MDQEKKQQARNLFLQTELNKTQIANLLNMSRRTLTYWVREGDWNRLKESSKHLPSLLAENCYHIMGNLTEGYLSERRLTNPVSVKEIDALHKLTITIGKLKNRSTLNESMEMFGFFMEGLKRRNASLAVELAPYIEEYISSRTSINIADIRPAHFTGVGGRIPWLPEDTTEQRLDAREAFFDDPATAQAYTGNGIELPAEEEMSTLPGVGEAPAPYTLDHLNNVRLAAHREFTTTKARVTAENEQRLAAEGQLSTSAQQKEAEAAYTLEEHRRTFAALRVLLAEKTAKALKDAKKMAAQKQSGGQQ